MRVERGLARAASACRALGLARSSFYRGGRENVEKRRVRKEVVGLSAKHPRYGYRRITALLRREGFEVNAKRVARIRREEGFKVSNAAPYARAGTLDGGAAACAACSAGVELGFRRGPDRECSRFRILTLIDEHTRESLAIHPAWSIRALDVIMVLEAAIARYGLRSSAQRQWARVYRLCHRGLAGREKDLDDLHHPWFPMGERSH